jgi:flagellar motor component MotA
MKKHFDDGSIIVIIITFVLFILALFTKGFSHDLLLEAGVFLVSVKLIMMAHNNSVFTKELKNELKEIKEILKKNESQLVYHQLRGWIETLKTHFLQFGLWNPN